MNKKPRITSACCTLYICTKISIGKPLVDISHIYLSWFPFSVSCKQNINLTEVFHVKPPRLGFSFLPPVSFEIFTESFSSWIFIFSSIHWLKKSDCSSLKLMYKKWNSFVCIFVVNCQFFQVIPSECVLSWPTIFTRPNTAHFEEKNSRPDFWKIICVKIK